MVPFQRPFSPPRICISPDLRHPNLRLFVSFPTLPGPPPPRAMKFALNLFRWAPTTITSTTLGERVCFWSRPHHIFSSLYRQVFFSSKLSCFPNRHIYLATGTILPFPQALPLHCRTYFRYDPFPRTQFLGFMLTKYLSTRAPFHCPVYAGVRPAPFVSPPSFIAVSIFLLFVPGVGFHPLIDCS